MDRAANSMLQQPDILDLVVRWEELHDAGCEVAPEDLCRDFPELLDEVSRQIHALQGMVQTLAETSPAPAERPSASDACMAASADGVHHSSDARLLRWPTIPGYEILAELNHGGMGVIYKARQVRLDRVVAIKMILSNGNVLPEQAARFLREARVMALLQHPNIVQIHEVGEHDGHAYLVMEYVPGGTLSEFVDNKPVAPVNAAEMTATLARAMAYAHHTGVVHRDLKPSNILLTADGVLKIGDFGLAKCFDVPVDFTHTTNLMGTPSYMAPEQLGVEPCVAGPAVDIYALGAVLYELVAGRPPFLADNPLDTLQLVRSRDPIPLVHWQPKTPRDLDTICLKCLEKDPRRRYADSQALSDDLGRFLAHQPILARPIGAPERIWRWSRVHPAAAAWIGMAVLAVVLVLSIVLAFNRRISMELAHTNAAHAQTVLTRGKLDRAIANEVADRLDSDLREMAGVPRMIAMMLERMPVRDEAVVQDLFANALKETPLIFGLTLAMEPYKWSADRENFALYVFRRGREFPTESLTPPSYLPLYREWPWYRMAKGGDGFWTEPYVDPAAEHTPMVTFSAPIYRDGRFVGVAAADLAHGLFPCDARQHRSAGLGAECILHSCYPRRTRLLLIWRMATNTQTLLPTRR